MTRSLIRWMIILILGCIFFSCAPTKKSAYFQKYNKVPDINVPDKVYYRNIDSTDYIHKGDELFISVTSGNDDPNSFNQSTGVPLTDLELISYPVDNNGFIRLPYLKRIKVDGLSTNQLIDTLETKLSQYIYLPAVSIRIINNRIAILGEVNAPGEYLVNRNSFNIYQAIALAGDISTFGNRKNVLIIRQEGNTILKKQIDLTNDAILNSNWYNIRPEDIIYVEPLGRKRFGMETFSIFSFVTVLTSTYLIYTIIVDLTQPEPAPGT